jgi:hypothetical protein
LISLSGGVVCDIAGQHHRGPAERHNFPILNGGSGADNPIESDGKSTRLQRSRGSQNSGGEDRPDSIAGSRAWFTFHPDTSSHHFNKAPVNSQAQTDFPYSRMIDVFA